MKQDIWSLDKSEAYRQKRRAQATVNYLNINPKDIILDVGCSEGYIISHFSKSSFAVGTDISKVSLLVAKQKVCQPNIDFVQANGTALPFKSDSFNKISLLEVLEHLSEEKQKLFCKEIDRLLTKNSILIISTPYKENIPYNICIHCGKPTPLWGHLCSLDEEKISNLLPTSYSQIAQYHLPNIPLVSLSATFQHLPFRLWSVLNNILGRVRKGYWIVLKYKKVMNTIK